jgi:hypothetical protein
MKILGAIMTVAAVAILIGSFPALTSAQGTYGQTDLEGVAKTVYGSAATAQGQLPLIVGGVIKAAIAIVGLIFVILLVYAGYIWMMARGEEKSVEKAKDTIMRAIIGLFIVIAAYAIASFVVARLTSVATG